MQKPDSMGTWRKVFGRDFLSLQIVLITNAQISTITKLSVKDTAFNQ